MIEGERRPIQETRPAVGRWLGQLVGVLLLGLVLVGYLVPLRIGAWPPSHPWSGMSLVALALMNLGLHRWAPGPRGVVLRIAAAILSTVGAVFWLAATLMRVSR
jgi:hypothetical protein